MSQRIVDIHSLSPEERLRLIGDLWDSLEHSREASQLSNAQEAELDLRLDALESQRSGPSGIPWDDVLREIRQRR